MVKKTIRLKQPPNILEIDTSLAFAVPISALPQAVQSKYWDYYTYPDLVKKGGSYQSRSAGAKRICLREVKFIISFHSNGDKIDYLDFDGPEPFGPKVRMKMPAGLPKPKEGSLDYLMNLAGGIEALPPQIWSILAESLKKLADNLEKNGGNIRIRDGLERFTRPFPF